MVLVKKIRRLKLYSLISLLVFTSVACKSTDHILSAEDEKEEWEIVKVEKTEKPTWVIYRRKTEGTNILEYKIEGTVESTPSACIDSFKQDLYNLSNGIEKESEYEYIKYEVVADTTDSLSIYAIHNEPFPFKDTEMSILYTFNSDTTGTTEVRWREAWNEHPVPESKKLKRVESFRGSWQFSTVSKASYLAVNRVEFDLGKFPLWLAQPMVFKFLKNGLKDMRAISSE
jgi:hypothetical protein